jgi:tetratricopeptide (TPR) repeat protein
MKIKTLNNKKILSIFILYLIIMLLFTISGWAQNNKPSNNELFNQANLLYEKGDYTKAVTIYRQLTTTGYENGNLLFNIGNAYFKSGHKGLAVLYYEKARRYIPMDNDLKTNLALALNSVDEGEINWSHEFFRSLNNLAPLNQLTLGSSICFFLFVLLIVLLILIPAPLKQPNTGHIKSWYRVILVLCGCFLFSLVSLTSLTYFDRRQPQAVAIKNGGPVLNEPNSNGTIYYYLAEGSRVVLKTTKANWCLIKRQDGKRGWVERQYLGQL